MPQESTERCLGVAGDVLSPCACLFRCRLRGSCAGMVQSPKLGFAFKIEPCSQPGKKKCDFCHPLQSCERILDLEVSSCFRTCLLYTSDAADE